MKIRNGFVSNSSSSSYVIVCKKGALRREYLIKAFDVGKKSPLYKTVLEMVNILFESCKKLNQDFLNGEGSNSKKQYLEEYIYDERMEKLIRENKNVYIGSVASDGDPSEVTLCAMDFEYEDENIILDKETR